MCGLSLLIVEVLFSVLVCFLSLPRRAPPKLTVPLHRDRSMRRRRKSQGPYPLQLHKSIFLSVNGLFLVLRKLFILVNMVYRLGLRDTSCASRY